MARPEDEELDFPYPPLRDRYDQYVVLAADGRIIHTLPWNASRRIVLTYLERMEETGDCTLRPIRVERRRAGHAPEPVEQ